jgi:amino acid adenylation domain-containing protein
MTTLEFLRHLRGLKIKIWLEGEKLRFNAPQEAMTSELREELTQRKPEIVRFLRQFSDDFHASMPRIQRAFRDGQIPLSFAQQRLWFLDKLDPGVPTYSVCDAIEINRQIDVEVLRRALNEIVRRHEILRTTFPDIGGVPVQAIAQPASVPLPVVDLTILPEADRMNEAHRLAAEEARLPFDLAKGPLLRVKLVRIHDAHYLWLLSIHHIISDDWSKKLLDRELETLYAAYSQGLPSPLPELPIQWADFAIWQRQWLKGSVLESHVNYWAEQLKGDLPVLALPTDRPRYHPSRGSTGKFTFSRALSTAIRALSDREKVTPFMTLVAGYAALLSRYTGQDEVMIGSSISDRNQVETERLIGFLLNTLVLRVRLAGNPTFRELLAQVREVCLGAHAHQEVPYESLLQRLPVSRDASGSPLFQTMLGLLNTPPVKRNSDAFWGARADWDGIAAESVEDSQGSYVADENNGTTKFDLSINVIEHELGYHGTTEYNTDLFDHEAIARIIERFQIVLASATGNPEQRISELPIMTEAQAKQMLGEWSGCETEPSQVACIHQLFEVQAAQTPDNIALEGGGESVTYAALNARSNQLARLLRQMGAGPEVMVGIFLDRSPEMVAAILATLKAGATYVPLDPSYPKQRLAFMVEDAQVKILLTHQALLPDLPSHSARVVCLDGQWARLAAENSENLSCLASAESQVCLLYTSGSTGRPKGVIVTHGPLVNYTVSAIQQYRMTPKDRVLQFASVSFDASLEEIFTALGHGAAVVLRPDRMLDSISAFLSHCRELRLTTMVLPTAYWHEIVSRLAVEELPATLRLVVIGGERALPNQLAEWQKRIGERVALVNTYGPTEGTIAVTRCQLPGVAAPGSEGREVSLGRPVENTKVYVLDRWMQPAPSGVLGELYVGAQALARGYLNRSDLTAESFVPDPFSHQPGARLYRTGDLVRFLPDGSLEYRGRTDDQIKIRGYRVEPGEIEAALEKHEAVKHAVVLAREDHPGLRQLVAYIVCRAGTAATASDLRAFLRSNLPDYMLPAAFVFLVKLPFTSSGKVDRRALPAPDRTRADLKEELVAPRTPTEEALACIWRAVLKLDRIGIYENFFELGGHSLLATQVVARMSDAMHVDLPLRRLFETPTIAELAATVETLKESGTGKRSRVLSFRRHLDAVAVQYQREEEYERNNSEPAHAIASPVAVDEPGMEQVLAGIEGLTDVEVKALLGEEDEIETGG